MKKTLSFIVAMLTTITLFANDLVSTQSMSYGTGYEIFYTSTDGKIVNPASRDDSFGGIYCICKNEKSLFLWCFREQKMESVDKNSFF